MCLFIKQKSETNLELIKINKTYFFIYYDYGKKTKRASKFSELRVSSCQCLYILTYRFFGMLF